MTRPIQINKYLPVAILYFFFNGFLLPHGLLYTTLLTPLLALWLYHYLGTDLFKHIGYFILCLSPFIVAHLVHGVNLAFYWRSFLLFLSVFIFSLAVYQFLTVSSSIRVIYKQLLLINLPLILFALFILTQPAYVDGLWYTNEITNGVSGLKRLKMFTYEPSYYALLFAPIALYYILKMIILKIPNPKTIIVLLAIPMLLSLSFGVILGLALSLILTFLYGLGNFFPDKNWPLYVLLACFAILVALSLALIIFPDNIFFLRIENVFAGKDTSFRGRTFDSFYLGWEIANAKSLYFGVGLGQVKEIGLDYFARFYNNTAFTPDEIGIPNAVGDTLATFGLVGVFFRFLLEIYLFFKTKVSSNYYRLCLFLFIFIYQFTGSFIMNIAEYLIWVMAFHPWIFEEFDKSFFINRSKQAAGLATSIQ
jgi:O-Antigen ligase